MNALLTITTNEQGLFVVSSVNFAEGLEIQHKNLIETIRTHQLAIEKDFGLIAFETEAVKREGERGTKYSSIAHLTEEQALFIGTLSRNTKRVVEFKSTLVRSFAEARKRLQPEPPLPASQDDLILMLAQRNVETARRLSVVEDRLDRFEQIQQTATTELLALPTPTEPMAEMPRENEIIRLVNTYSQAKAVAQPDVWRKLYSELLYRYRISVNAYKRPPGESKIQMLKRLGHIEKLHTIATNVLQVAQPVA